MPITISEPLIHPLLWRILGFGSSIVGFTCYALSPSFFDLFGKLSLPKIVIYSVISLILCTLMLFVKKCRGFTRNVLVRAHVGFLVLMLTSLYSFWEDRASQQGNEEKGSHGRILNLSSCGAFGLMSLSLSRQLELGFEVGVFNFFVGCFLVTLMKINFKLAPVAACLCYVLVNIRSFSDFLLEMRRRRESGDTLGRDIESGSRDIHYLRDSDSEEENEKKAEKVMHALLVSLFGDVKVGENGKLVINVDGNVAELDKQSGDVESENEGLKERVRTAFRRIQSSVKPVPLSASL